MTLISAIDSVFTEMATALLPESMVETPSIMMFALPPEYEVWSPYRGVVLLPLTPGSANSQVLGNSGCSTVCS